MTGYDVVAIPSYRRPNTIAETTLPILRAGGVPLDRVHVWVADDEDAAAYKRTLSADWGGVTLIRGGYGQGVMHARNAITTGYPAGTRLLQIDDDIRRIVRAADEKTLVDVEDVDGLFTYGFTRAAEVGVSLWCLYPAANPYFMKQRETVGLLYAEGCVMGMTLRGDPVVETVTVDDKEDFERSLRHFIADGGVLRLDRYSFKSRFYTEPGGMQTYRTLDTINTGARVLADRWPDLCTYHVSKSRGMPEVRLKRLAWRHYPPGGPE